MTYTTLRSISLLRRGGLLLALGVFSLTALASTADPELQIALDGIWELERPGISTLSEQIDRKDGSDPARFESDQRDALAYVHAAAEGAEIEFARKRFSAVESPWGALPRLDMSTARLLEVTLPRKRYLVLSATGEGLFRIGDWQRFGFLHVVDVSQRWAPLHYPLVAEAGLRERVIGRLPGSPVLNYLRLVPSAWRDASTIDAYEVLVYALNPKGAERARDGEGREISFLLSRENDARRWQLNALAEPSTAIARDAAGAGFSAPQLASSRESLPSQAEASASPATPMVSPTTASSSAASPIAGTSISAAGSAGQPAKAATASNVEAAKSALSPSHTELEAVAKAEPSLSSQAEAAAKAKAQHETEGAARDSAAAAMKKKLPGLR